MSAGTTFAVSHRPGATVQERIQAAVTIYYRQHRVLPVAIVVNPREVEAARAALAALQLRLSVRGAGGCLVMEVWLEVVGAS